MKTKFPSRLKSALVLAFAPATLLLAQTTAVDPTAAVNTPPVSLSAFIVDVSRDRGYIAVDSLAGGRTNTPIFIAVGEPIQPYEPASELTAQLRSTMQEMLLDLQEGYAHEPGAYWVPARFYASHLKKSIIRTNKLVKREDALNQDEGFSLTAMLSIDFKIHFSPLQASKFAPKDHVKNS